jgi:hypothetical protein
MELRRPLTPPAAVERPAQLARLVYELLDAHADTEHLWRSSYSGLRRRAHLEYLCDLQRVAREVPADAT